MPAPPPPSRAPRFDPFKAKAEPTPTKEDCEKVEAAVRLCLRPACANGARVAEWDEVVDRCRESLGRGAGYVESCLEALMEEGVVYEQVLGKLAVVRELSAHEERQASEAHEGRVAQARNSVMRQLKEWDAQHRLACAAAAGHLEPDTPERQALMAVAHWMQGAGWLAQAIGGAEAEEEPMFHEEKVQR